jgi:N-acetylglucosaminyl-diphospho-decaprenol L-rhamnosyltransferase
VARRVLGAVDPGEVPVQGLTRAWAAVLVNFEAGPLLVECVRSVLGDTSAGTPELVVVDNGSRDGSVDLLRREFPSVRVVRAPGNVGYARAANLGIAATSAPVVAVLNTDTEVAEGTAAALLRRFERSPRLGAVGPRIRNLDGSDYPSARSQPSIVDAIGHGLFGLFRPRNRFTRRYRQLDADPGRTRAVDWLSGAALWLRRAALDDVGGWDERYFMYMEDLDLCWRLRGHDWDVVYEPAGSVRHVQGASTARRPYRMLLEHHRSAWRFARRRFTGWRRVLLPFTAAYLSLRALLAMSTHWARTRTGGVSTSR